MLKCSENKELVDVANHLSAMANLLSYVEHLGAEEVLFEMVGHIHGALMRFDCYAEEAG